MAIYEQTPTLLKQLFLSLVIPDCFQFQFFFCVYSTPYKCVGQYAEDILYYSNIYSCIMIWSVWSRFLAKVKMRFR